MQQKVQQAEIETLHVSERRRLGESYYTKVTTSESKRASYKEQWDAEAARSELFTNTACQSIEINSQDDSPNIRLTCTFVRIEVDELRL